MSVGEVMATWLESLEGSAPPVGALGEHWISGRLKTATGKMLVMTLLFDMTDP
jgi:hypothetical protein